MGQLLDAIATSLEGVWVGRYLNADIRIITFDLHSVGFWSQLILAAGLVGWVTSYFLRVVTGNMTYNQQRQDYEDAFLEQRLQEMTPEELEALSASVDDASVGAQTDAHQTDAHQTDNDRADNPKAEQ